MGQALCRRGFSVDGNFPSKDYTWIEEKHSLLREGSQLYWSPQDTDYLSGADFVYVSRDDENKATVKRRQKHCRAEKRRRYPLIYMSGLFLCSERCTGCRCCKMVLSSFLLSENVQSFSSTFIPEQTKDCPRALNDFFRSSYPLLLSFVERKRAVRVWTAWTAHALFEARCLKQSLKLDRRVLLIHFFSLLL